MKKFVISMLILILIVSLAAHASAITTGKWDFQAGYQHAQDTAKDMLEQETAEELPGESGDTWQDWIHRWLDTTLQTIPAGTYKDSSGIVTT